jgi:hypothetical protein
MLFWRGFSEKDIIHTLPLLVVDLTVYLSFHFIDPVYISELEYGRSILFLSFKFFFQ